MFLGNVFQLSWLRVSGTESQTICASKLFAGYALCLLFIFAASLLLHVAVEAPMNASRDSLFRGLEQIVGLGCSAAHKLLCPPVQRRGGSSSREAPQQGAAAERTCGSSSDTSPDRSAATAAARAEGNEKSRLLVQAVV